MSDETVLLLRHPAFLGGFGVMVGSFLNVVIHRLPLRMSLVSPGSRCPKCSRPVAPRDNIPVVSWLLLRGRCRGCGERISPRYPFVEIATAALFAACGRAVPGPADLPFALLFVAAMVVVTFIDLDHMIIPDTITIPGVGLGLAAALLGRGLDLAQALLGILAGGGGLFAVAAGYRAMTGRDGLGAGDIKLLAMVGAFLGPVGALLTVFVGSLAGTLYACAFLLRRGGGRTSELPFGTFLAPGAILVLFLGHRIVEAYGSLFL